MQDIAKHDAWRFDGRLRVEVKVEHVQQHLGDARHSGFSGRTTDEHYGFAVFEDHARAQGETVSLAWFEHEIALFAAPYVLVQVEPVHRVAAQYPRCAEHVVSAVDIAEGVCEG